MKSRIFIFILVLALLIGGLFLPTKSGLTDEAEPESNPISVFHEAEEEQQAAEEQQAEEERRQEESEMISTLPEAEQEAYAWAALRSDPESLLMTPERIAEYNTNLLTASSLVDIYKVPDYTPEIIAEQLRDDQDRLSGLAVSEDVLANQNMDSNFHALRLGVILTHTVVTLLPTEEEIEGNDFAVLSCSSPVWVLHTSKDSKWYYVQSTYARGWVPSSNVALASSEEIWKNYTNPEQKVIITVPEITLEGTVLDMGAVLSCLEENGDSYTVLLPTRRSDGALEANQVSITRDVSSLGYQDYTWIHLFKQVYLYQDADSSMTTERMIGQIYRTFNLILPSDLKADFDSLGTVTELEGLTAEECNNALNGIQAPSLVVDADGLGLLLGTKDGAIWKLQLQDGKPDITQINEPVKLVQIG